MGTHRTPATGMFAVEMMRACLPQVPGFRYDMWMHMAMEMGEGDFRAVNVAIKIYGIDESFYMNGNITREDGVWTRGSCTIRYGNDQETTWSFTCERVENRLVAKMVWATIPATQPR
jgi:hypothetical protein